MFSLKEDPTEKVNLAALQPDRLAQMPAPLWPSFIELPIAIDKTLNQKQTKQDEYNYWYN